jgi:hypothetical protein
LQFLEYLIILLCQIVLIGKQNGDPMTVGAQRRKLAIRLAVLIGLVLGAVADARAQVPPHVPGTICFTQWFWCVAQPPGPPGTQCACPSPQGWIPGVRG